MTDAGSAEAQILAATVNSIFSHNESSSNNTPNDEDVRDNFTFQEQPMAFNTSYDDPDASISTNFLN